MTPKVKPKNPENNGEPEETDDVETPTKKEKSTPTKKKLERKSKNLQKKKKKYAKKRKEEEVRIFFPPPRINPPLKTPFRLHNTTCQHHGWAWNNLNLPKYATNQVGWRASYRKMRSIYLIDSRRAEFLTAFNLYSHKRIRKAIVAPNRNGVQKLDRMPRSWNPETENSKFFDETDEEVIPPVKPVKTEEEPAEEAPPNRRKFFQNRIKTVKRMAFLTMFRKKRSKNPRYRRYLRRTRTKHQRMIEFRRPRNGKWLRIRNKERVTIIPRIRILRKNLVHKRECRVDPENLLRWLKRQELDEEKKILKEKEKILREQAEDAEWERYESTRSWDSEVVSNRIVLEVDQLFRHKNEDWIVIEKKGSPIQGYQYMLVPVSEYNGEIKMRYDRQYVDHRFRKMRNENGRRVEFVTSLPIYKPKPPKIHYPTFAGQYEEQERELERRRLEEEERDNRDAQYEMKDRTNFKVLMKRQSLIKRYRQAIQKEVWRRRRRHLKELSDPMSDSDSEDSDYEDDDVDMNPELDSSFYDCEPSTSTAPPPRRIPKPIKSILKPYDTPLLNDVKMEEEDEEVAETKKIKEEVLEASVKIEMNGFPEEIPLKKNGRRRISKKNDVLSDHEDVPVIKKEVIFQHDDVAEPKDNKNKNKKNGKNNKVKKFEINGINHEEDVKEFKTEIDDIKIDVNILTNETQQISLNYSPVAFKPVNESHNNSPRKVSSSDKPVNHVRFELTKSQQLAALYKPMTWQIKELIRTVGVGRGYKMRTKRSRYNEKVRLYNIFGGKNRQTKAAPKRLDVFEKGIDIREEPIPFVEEFILDDHALVAFASYDDLKRFEQAKTLRQEEMIQKFWRTQCLKNIAQFESGFDERKIMQEEIESLENEMKVQKSTENQELDQENKEAFETAGRQVEAIIEKTGDCPFDTLEEYFAISADFQKQEDIRIEEDQIDIETEHWDQELEELISLIKKEFSLVDLMMRYLSNRHLLTMQLVVSGMNQSPIDREDLLLKVRRLLQELESKRMESLERAKRRYDKTEEHLQRFRIHRIRAIKRAKKLVKSLRKSKKNGRKCNGTTATTETIDGDEEQPKKGKRKWRIVLKPFEEKIGNMKKKKKKRKRKRRKKKIRRARRSHLKQGDMPVSRDLRWGFKSFIFRNGMARRMPSITMNTIRRAVAWGAKIEDLYGETEFEKLLRSYLEQQEKSMAQDVTIEQKMELIMKLKVLTLDEARKRATEKQRKMIDNAVEMMIKSRMQQINTDHRAWLDSAECKLYRVTSITIIMAAHNDPRWIILANTWIFCLWRLILPFIFNQNIEDGSGIILDLCQNMDVITALFNV
ncbi:hypothetical protein CAEBREN_17620 [Caenorhabditis brenneri]|uniref:Uncharacterized protein n=1 Tax=Caenorhabditis brenneri TaxID=135651 RepID=G0NBS0_CAEBE|nr:hypothetical protein CAEBREN_17620 [Caenorhabditis brenneri]